MPDEKTGPMNKPESPQPEREVPVPEPATIRRSDGLQHPTSLERFAQLLEDLALLNVLLQPDAEPEMLQKLLQKAADVRSALVGTLGGNRD